MQQYSVTWETVIVQKGPFALGKECKKYPFKKRYLTEHALADGRLEPGATAQTAIGKCVA